MKPKISTDIIGIVTSIACAIHCAILPLFLTGLSVFGVNIIHNFWFETGM
ncbi:MAG TPA: MerC domain-containing protein, partial [Puia sp.]